MTALPEHPFVPAPKKYLQPSVFWGIRQGFPKRLALLLMGLALGVPLLVWAIASYGGWVRPNLFAHTDGRCAGGHWAMARWAATRRVG